MTCWLSPAVWRLREKPLLPHPGPLGFMPQKGRVRLLGKALQAQDTSPEVGGGQSGASCLSLAGLRQLCSLGLLEANEDPCPPHLIRVGKRLQDSGNLD